jgi:hypothetical protein
MLGCLFNKLNIVTNLFQLYMLGENTILTADLLMI